jgi:hypothetical protein
MCGIFYSNFGRLGWRLAAAAVTGESTTFPVAKLNSARWRVHSVANRMPSAAFHGTEWRQFHWIERQGEATAMAAGGR